jgi:hypothetical protein
LKTGVQGENRKELWLEARKQWERGLRGCFTPGDIESFQKGEEFCKGLYRQWIGYTDPREGFTDLKESSTRSQVYWKGQESLQREREDSIDRSDAWDGSMDRGDG